MNLLSQELPEAFKHLVPRYVGMRMEKGESYKKRANIDSDSTEINKILALVAQGLPQAQIATELGLLYARVNYICTRYGASKNTKNRIRKVCQGCGATRFLVPTYAKAFKFCSIQCRYGDQS